MRVVGASRIVLLLFSRMNPAVEPTEVVIARHDGLDLQSQLLEELLLGLEEILKQFLFFFAHMFFPSVSRCLHAVSTRDSNGKYVRIDCYAAEADKFDNTGKNGLISRTIYG